MKQRIKQHQHQLPDEGDDIYYQLELTRKKLASALNVNSAIISSIGDGVIIVDAYGAIREINDAALKMLQYERDDLLGQWLQKVLPSMDIEGRDMPATERPALKSMLTGAPYSEVTSYIRKDGSMMQVAGTASPFIVNDVPQGTVIIFRDFSREVAANQAKDEFISLASHQLRTPLTSTMLYVNMLKDLDDVSANETAMNYLRKVEGSTIGMLELIDDFLNISKLELGKLELKTEKLNVQSAIGACIDKVRAVAEDNHISIRFSHPKAPVYITTDPRLLTESIHNLLTNAIRYRNRHTTPTLHVSLKIKKSCISIAVKDNGIGIPKTEEPKIFDRLYRADNAKQVQDQGTGLGLYLVKKMVTALHGNLRFESEVGAGTTFYIELPLTV